MSGPAIRRAEPGDAAAVRRLVAETLLQAGFDAPDELRDPDLVDLDDYYRVDGRALWVAETRDGISGCTAIDRGEPGIAVLRRLAGDPLTDLVGTAVAFAREAGYREVETVLPPGMGGVQTALEAHGFRPDTPGGLLYRLPL